MVADLGQVGVVHQRRGIEGSARSFAIGAAASLRNSSWARGSKLAAPLRSPEAAVSGRRVALGI